MVLIAWKVFCRRRKCSGHSTVDTKFLLIGTSAFAFPLGFAAALLLFILRFFGTGLIVEPARSTWLLSGSSMASESTLDALRVKLIVNLVTCAYTWMVQIYLNRSERPSRASDDVEASGSSLSSIAAWLSLNSTPGLEASPPPLSSTRLFLLGIHRPLTGMSAFYLE